MPSPPVHSDERVPDESATDVSRVVGPAASPSQGVRNRLWVHAALLLATVGTTTWIGASHYASYVQEFVSRPIPFTTAGLLLRGTWYSATILAILGGHELGHYFACRYYRVRASLPYFLPAPVILTGTLGAFIRIREPIVSKRILFDIAIAGPIAGFLIAVPALFVGLSLSPVVELPPTLPPGSAELGEPLLFQLAAWLLWGTVPDGSSLNLHPMAFAAWFGLLATALNLFPVGQLDGGHISYALFGRRSTTITLGAIGLSVGLTFVSRSWIFWTLAMAASLILFGPRHPRTLDEGVPLDPPRRWLAAAALVMFALSFTPAPIEPLGLLGR